MEETGKTEEVEINNGAEAESIASLRTEVMHTGALNTDEERVADHGACALDLDALSAGLEDNDSADNTTSISAIHDDGANEESANGASDDNAEEISEEPEAQASDTTAPVAPKPKKRKKRRLRKWARVTLGAMGAIALMGGGYAIAMSANSPLSASTAAAADSARAESARTLMDTDESALGSTSVDASAAPTDSAVPIAREIDAESTESAEIAAANNAALPLGNRGRLYIGDWSVQLNGDDNNDAEALQTAADEPDSASYAEYNGKVMISDHANQGFSCIKALQVGDNITMKNVDGEGTTLEVVAAYPDAYYKDGYAMLPNGTDAWTTTDGDYILQTNGDDNGDTLYIVTCKVAEDAEASPEASASASAQAE